MVRGWTFAIAALALLGMAGTIGSAQAKDPDFLSFGVGYFDFNRQKDEGAEFRIEYRSDYEFWHLRPFVAAGAATSGHGFLGAGILLDIFLGRRVVVTPSFAPHLYFGGDDALDLDYPLEFRSQIEFAYRFDDRSRLGLALSHYSNAHLSEHNPGTETLSLYYTVPLNKIFDD